MKSKNQILTPLLAGLFVVGLLIMAYTLSRGKLTNTKETAFDKEIKEIQTQSPSDETSAIEADLNETDLSDIDQDLNNLESEFNQGY